MANASVSGTQQKVPWQVQACVAHHPGKGGVVGFVHSFCDPLGDRTVHEQTEMHTTLKPFPNVPIRWQPTLIFNRGLIAELAVVTM